MQHLEVAFADITIARLRQARAFLIGETPIERKLARRRPERRFEALLGAG
jgi:hypothetical protein